MKPMENHKLPFTVQQYGADTPRGLSAIIAANGVCVADNIARDTARFIVRTVNADAPALLAELRTANAECETRGKLLDQARAQRDELLSALSAVLQDTCIIGMGGTTFDAARNAIANATKGEE